MPPYLTDVDVEDLMKQNNTFIKSLEKAELTEAFYVCERTWKRKGVSRQVLWKVSQALKVISSLHEEHATMFFGNVDTTHAYSANLYKRAADEIYQGEGKALNILLFGTAMI